MSFWRRFGCEALGAALFAAAVTGCGKSDGSREFASGQTAYTAGDLRRAAEMFSRSTVANATNADAWVMLARVEVDLGELEEAKQAIETAARLADGVDIALLGAEIAFHLGEYDAAAREYRAVAENGAADAAIRSLAWTGLGIVEMARENRRDYARIAFLTAIRADRRNPSARYHLALLYRDAYGYNEIALDQFNAYVRLEAEADARVQRTQRTVIPALKEEIAARLLANRPAAAKRDSAASAAALVKAEEAFKKKNYKVARQRYEEALKADALNDRAALALAQTIEKTDTTAKGRQEALKAYKTACLLNPTSIRTFIAAGTLAAGIGQWASAVEYHSRAMAADPSNITAIDGLIRALRKVGGNAAVADAYQRYRDTIPVRRK